MHASNRRAKKHHFLSQCYLSAFTRKGRKDGRLNVIDVENVKEFTSKPRRVAAINDFFTLQIPGIGPEELEKMFGLVEGAFGQVQRKVIESGKLPEDVDDRNTLVGFVAFTFCRGLHMHLNVDRFLSEVLKKYAMAMLSSEATWNATVENARSDGLDLDTLSYEDMRDAVPKMTFAPERQAVVGLQLSGFYTLLRLVLMRRWSIMLADASSTGFVASDQPVSLVWNQERDGVYPPGFGLNGTIVFMPLSPRLVLVGDFEGQGISPVASSDLVATINQRTITNAVRHVFSRDREFRWAIRPGLYGGPDDLLYMLGA